MRADPAHADMTNTHYTPTKQAPRTGPAPDQMNKRGRVTSYKEKA